MADKRRSSKQRRQARNRAQRDALAARTEAAGRNPAPRAPAARSSSSSTGGAGQTHGSGSASRSAEREGRAGTGTLGGTGGRGRGLLGLRGRRRPGDLAVTLALAFAIAGSIALPLSPVTVDDRGEQLDSNFRGLALEARSMITGETVEAESETLISASGPVVLLLALVPLAIAAAAFWINRTRAERSRFLTIAMVLMAVVVFFGGQLYLFSLVALAVGSFQVRKQEMPARMAQKIAPPDEGDQVIDVDDVETEEERALAELEEELRGEADAPEGGNGSRPR